MQDINQIEVEYEEIKPEKTWI